MDAIQTKGLTRIFDGRTAVEDLTLTIPTGSVFGFLGPNGAGKTTTVRLLTALIAPSGGEATVLGHRLGLDNSAIRQQVGILTETPGLYDRISALENLLFFARLYEMKEQHAQRQAERYLRTLDMWDRRNDPVGGFSKGMRQKLAIVRALLHEPALVFLDEPTSGLDPEAARTVRAFVKELRAEGRTIFLTTHNLYEADELCDLIGVFRTRLLRLDTPANLRTALFGRGTRVTLGTAAAPLLTMVRDLPFVQEVSAEAQRLLVRLEKPDEQNPALIRALIAANAPIQYVEPLSHSLEDVYLELVGAEGNA